MHHEVRPATEADLIHIATNLKQDDLQELEALGYGREDILLSLSASSKVLAWGPEGEPLAIFGVHPDGIVGYIWSLSTPEILPRWREVHLSTPAILDELGRDFCILANVKDARHRHHIRWLKALGFTFINTHRLGPHSLPFHEFVRIQK